MLQFLFKITVNNRRKANALLKFPREEMGF